MVDSLNIEIHSRGQGLPNVGTQFTTPEYNDPHNPVWIPRVGTKATGIDRDTEAVVDLVFGKHTGSTSEIGGFFTFADYFTGVALVPNAKGSVGVATSERPSGSYGWFVIGGKCKAASLDGASGSSVYATATAGRPGATVVAGDRVKGARRTSSTTGANFANYFLDGPYMDDGEAA